MIHNYKPVRQQRLVSQDQQSIFSSNVESVNKTRICKVADTITCYFISLVSQQCLEGRDELQIRGGSDVIVSTQLIEESDRTMHC